MLSIQPEASALEFRDCDYSRWSQEVTCSNLLASHQLDPDHVAASVTSSTMDKEAAIAACQIAVERDPEKPD